MQKLCQVQDLQRDDPLVRYAVMMKFCLKLHCLQGKHALYLVTMFYGLNVATHLDEHLGSIVVQSHVMLFSL